MAKNKKIVPIDGKLINISPIISSWTDVKSKIRPLDLLLFNGTSVTSCCIKCSSKICLGDGADQVSHCGVVVTRDILDIPELNYGTLYVFESIKVKDSVYNIEKKRTSGCQIRKLEDVLSLYRDNPVIWAKLCDNPATDENNTRIKMLKLYHRFITKKYEIDPIQLTSALVPILRLCRIHFFIQKRIFCSELCAHIYKEFGLFNGKPEDVVPADYIVHDMDNQVDISLFNYTKFQY